jgi:1-acyl-sn-glycerol-3-phosphate acyltransferase
MAEIALWQKATIVPVGCNGCDKLYPAGSPWAKGGTVTYRFGEPMPYESYAEHHIDEPFEPFTPAAEATYRDRFQALVDDVMERVNDLLDAPYQFSEDRLDSGVRGAKRFA